MCLSFTEEKPQFSTLTSLLFAFIQCTVYWYSYLTIGKYTDQDMKRWQTVWAGPKTAGANCNDATPYWWVVTMIYMSISSNVLSKMNLTPWPTCNCWLQDNFLYAWMPALSRRDWNGLQYQAEVTSSQNYQPNVIVKNCWHDPGPNPWLLILQCINITGWATQNPHHSKCINQTLIVAVMHNHRYWSNQC